MTEDFVASASSVIEIELTAGMFSSEFRLPQYFASAILLCAIECADRNLGSLSFTQLLPTAQSNGLALWVDLIALRHPV